MEAALGIAALVVVLLGCLAGVSAVSAQVRCIDAAREAARLAARGDEQHAIGAARRLAPAGAQVRVWRDGDFVRATVTGSSRLLPGLAVGAEQIAALEVSGPGR